jgi:penicillin amidase
MTRAARIARTILAGLLLVAGVCVLSLWWFIHRPLPKLDGTLSVPGLQAEVSVDRDQWGRPWIRAKSLDDMLLAQGYGMAQDRLWQMDLLRRASAGELSEIFGNATLEYDKENRTLGMRQAAERAAADATPEIRELLDAYARGVDAYIAQRGNALPIEFGLRQYKPRPWAASDTYLISLYMYKTLTTTWRAKLNRQWIVNKVGPERAADLFRSDSDLDVPVFGASAVPPVLRKSSAAQGSYGAIRYAAASAMPFPDFSPVRAERVGAATPPRGDDASSWLEAQALLGQFDRETREFIGSNNFVVSGEHTASGKPLLANDTHLSLGMPSIWYLVHLTCPGWNVEGFALPGAPLAIIGHNDRVAWGFTNSNADVQDLYAEEFDAANPVSYHANGGWHPADVRHEVIHVRGAPDVSLDIVSTRHGPIVQHDAANQGGRAYALRWTALEPGGLDFGYPLLGRAQNWNEFVETTRHIAGPGQNVVFADVDGNIGWTIPARIPIRAQGDGPLPLPGDSDDHEWRGYIPFEDLPRVENPPGGIIVTANAVSVGPSYKYFLTDRWAAPYRTRRIYELLSGRTGLTPADCNAIQNDIVSLPDDFLAKQLVAAMRTKQPKDPRTALLIHRLEGWDARAAADSPLVTFVEYTRHSVFFKILAPYLGYDAERFEFWPPLSPYEEVWWRDKEFLRRVLESRPANWLPSSFPTYDDLLLASADEAVGELERETNSADPNHWAWGQLHPLIMDHPFARGSKWIRRLLSIGPIAQGGTGDTVRAMGVSNGPAMRFVADLSNFDRSLMEVSTGESGVYSSPYYRDQFEEWFAGRGIVAPFSEAAETTARMHHLELQPAAQ